MEIGREEVEANNVEVEVDSEEVEGYVGKKWR